MKLPATLSSSSGRVLTLVAGACLASCFPRDNLDDYSAQASLQAGGDGGSSGDGSANVGGTSSGPGGEAGSGMAAGAGGGAGTEEPPPPAVPDAGLGNPPPDETPPDPPDASAPPPDANEGEVACVEAGGVVTPSGGSCVVARSATVSFDEALAECNDTWGGGQLVTIRDLETDQLVTQILDDADAGDAWIGLAAENRGNDMQPPGPLLYLDGEEYDPNADFANWGTGQPDAFAGQACVEKRMAQPPGGPDAVGTWYDQVCDVPKAFVCERTLDSLL